MSTTAVQPFPGGGREVPMSDSGVKEEHQGGLHIPKLEEEDEKPRGRRRNRARNSNDLKDGASAPDIEKAPSSGEEGEDGPDGPRKRRRSRKGHDKKFPCKDCEKTYSRAEHLYRHQLNHTRKQIYTCDIGDCTRQFVRQDLCNRHRERHTAPGSQLQRKDAMQNNVSTANSITKFSMHGSSSPELARADSGTSRGAQIQFQSPVETYFSPIGPHPPSDFARPSPNPHPADANGYQQAGIYHRSQSDLGVQSSLAESSGQSFAQPGLSQRHGSISTIDDKAAVTFLQGRTPQQLPVSSFTAASQTPQEQQAYTSFHGAIGAGRLSIQAPYVSDHGFAPFSLPPSSFSPGPATTSSAHGFQASASYAIPSPQATMASEFQDTGFGHQSGAEMMYLDQMGATETMPVFGNESFENQRSPFAIADNFVAYIFNAQQYGTPQGQTAPQSIMNSYSDVQSQYQPYLANEINLGGYFPQNQQHPMAVTSLLEPSTPDIIISEDKSQEIVDLIRDRFNETDHDAIPRQKELMLEGDRSSDSHVLSKRMMQIYINSFWLYFHPQLPILHKPTFLPDKAPNLLLIAMMAIGASLLGKDYHFNLTQSCAELANFLAWHLRWKLFMHSQFGPPGKLWVFQSLLLLEVYEKMYSTRALHERATVHHATTITNMRRGSSLVGRSALDSPPSARDGKLGFNGSRQSSASGANTPDEWWNHWITNEATHRAAWAAFVIDSVHATMFGHSTVMVANEMRLQLPCDETLWSAISGAEVGKMETTLQAKGIKRFSLMEALRRTLEHQTVPTNAFGRTILMAGLLSVRWHMNQRDLQLNSLGPQALGGPHKWRGPLTRAFDFWKEDFDNALASARNKNPGPYQWGSKHDSKQDEEIVFESRTVLHHLAHMAMHVDIVECQIFARAKRLLGRNIGPRDLRDCTRNMKDRWAPTAKARDATFYAIQFLCTVLNPDDYSGVNPGYDPPTYSAREDVLMNKSWVLYYAALTVWCYAFALEGPSRTHLPSEDPMEQVRAMHVYLRRMSKVKSPEDLKLVTGFNECAGMLQVLQLTFADTRWELLHEAAKLLTNCVRLIGGQME